VPAGSVAAASLLGTSILLLPFALLTLPAHTPPAGTWLAALGLGVLCTGLAYAIYFRLIHRVGAPRAATVTFLVPLFGVLWAWAVRGEPLTVTMALSGTLILGGVALSQGRPRA